MYQDSSKKDIRRNTICLTDADYDYIIDKIERQDKIEFEITVSGNSDDE